MPKIFLQKGSFTFLEEGKQIWEHFQQIWLGYYHQKMHSKNSKLPKNGHFLGCVSKRPGLELWHHQKWIIHQILHKHGCFGQLIQFFSSSLNNAACSTTECNRSFCSGRLENEVGNSSCCYHALVKKK